MAARVPPRLVLTILPRRRRESERGGFVEVWTTCYCARGGVCAGVGMLCGASALQCAVCVSAVLLGRVFAVCLLCVCCVSSTLGLFCPLYVLVCAAAVPWIECAACCVCCVLNPLSCTPLTADLPCKWSGSGQHWQRCSRSRWASSLACRSPCC